MPSNQIINLDDPKNYQNFDPSGMLAAHSEFSAIMPPCLANGSQFQTAG